MSRNARPASAGPERVSSSPAPKPALQSPLSRMFPHTVLGTVVIGDYFSFSEDMFENFDIVNPPLDELLSSPEVCEFFFDSIVRPLRRRSSTAAPIEASIDSDMVDILGDSFTAAEFPEAKPKRSKSSIVRSLSKLKRALFNPQEKDDAQPGGAKAEEDAMTARRIVREGGYIVFSNRYIATHPHSHIAALTKTYRLAKPPAPFVIDPDLPEAKRKTMQIVQFIDEAVTQSRPLFRLRSAVEVYGEAEYAATEEELDLVELQARRSGATSLTTSFSFTPQSALSVSGPSHFYSSLKAFHLSRSAPAAVPAATSTEIGT